MPDIDASMPHGRLWVAERGCDCPECSAVLRQSRINEMVDVRMEAADDLAAEDAARRRADRRHARLVRPVGRPSGLSWRNTPRGWAVCGPANLVKRGPAVVKSSTGKETEVYITSLGKVFQYRNGVMMRYGYIRR